VGTIAQMRQGLVRRWILCTADGLLGDGSQSEAGIEIEAGADRYHALSRDAAGQLVRSGYQGALEYVDTSSINGRPMVQVNFSTNRGVTITSHPVITADPAYLIINNNGVREYRYLAAD
jgi:hypothetical protein